MLTPDFASPEQIRGDAVTTASDIYSLGVILYRLLTGRGPYRLTHARADEIQLAVCQQDPTRPSTALLRQNDDADDEETRSGARAAAERHTSVDRLRRDLRGDLDNIVLMAMRKEPARRYASAEQLSGDIGRHLEGLPVIARKDTIVYRATTFVRRNRLAVFSGVIVFFALASGILVSSAQRDAARLAEEHAVAGAAHARIEADSASEIAALLVDVLQANAPRSASGAHAIMSDLDREVERVRRQYADRRHIQANLIDSVGIVYMQIGAYDRAETLMQEAHTLRLDEFGGQSLEIARSFTSLGRLRFERGHPEEAAEFFRAALDLHRRLPSDVHTDIAGAANNLAVALRGSGETDEAEELHLEALALRRSVSQRAPVVADSLNNLAGIYIGRGDYDAAESALREALAIRREILGDHHPLTAQTTSNLAVTLHQAGDLNGAEELYRQSLATQRATPSLDEAGLVATLTILADLLRTRRAFDESDKLLREALDTQLRLTGPDHLQVAVVRAQLARLAYVRAEHEAARSEWDEVLRIRRLSLPEDHILIGQSLNDYGLVLMHTGKLERAESTLRRAVAIHRSALPAEHWQQGIVAACLAECLVTRRQYDEAETLLRSAYELLERTRGEDSAEAMRVAELLARLATQRAAEIGDEDDA
jgi:serine/threonine-protein kinase